MGYRKQDVFSEELSWITDSNIRSETAKIISELPDYFFETAASSTGKYHPQYALGEGGLVRHTKAAAKILHDLSSLEFYRNKFSDEQIDLMIAAILLHDGMKHGADGAKYTITEHPIVMAEYIVNNHKDGFTSEQLEFISGVISSHMGQFNTDYKTKKEVLPKPKTEAEFFVHLADYLASRKYLIVEFENYYNPSNYSFSEGNQLSGVITQIIDECKTRISNGDSRDELYDLIASLNNGEKNPTKIQDVKTANRVLKAIKSR